MSIVQKLDDSDEVDWRRNPFAWLWSGFDVSGNTTVGPGGWTMCTWYTVPCTTQDVLLYIGSQPLLTRNQNLSTVDSRDDHRFPNRVERSHMNVIHPTICCSRKPQG